MFSFGEFQLPSPLLFIKILVQVPITSGLGQALGSHTAVQRDGAERGEGAAHRLTSFIFCNTWKYPFQCMMSLMEVMADYSDRPQLFILMYIWFLPV